MRKPTAVALALTALLMVAFQNCGKLGFSLAHNGKIDAALSLGRGDAPSLTVTGDVPVKAGADATLTVLAKNATSDVSYSCARQDDATVVIGDGTLPLFDGVAVLTIRVDFDLTCTFTVHAGAQSAQNVFELPLEPATTL